MNHNERCEETSCYTISKLLILSTFVDRIFIRFSQQSIMSMVWEVRRIVEKHKGQRWILVYMELLRSKEPTTVTTFRTNFWSNSRIVYLYLILWEKISSRYKGIDILLLDSLCVNEEHSSLKLLVYSTRHREDLLPSYIVQKYNIKKVYKYRTETMATCDN